MEFSKKDRDFLIKTAKQLSAVEKRVKVLEKIEKQAAVKSPITLSDIEHQADAEFSEETELRAIRVTFRTPTTPKNSQERQILAQTLYVAIKNLCEVHDIEGLSLQLENI